MHSVFYISIKSTPPVNGYTTIFSLLHYMYNVLSLVHMEELESLSKYNISRKIGKIREIT